MKNLEQHFSKDLLITKPSNSVRKYSESIPFDLLIDIFSRVPANSIARFRCISKLWSTILVSPDFTELFLTKSLTCPRILFIFKANEKFFVFSTHQPQNPHENLSLVATRYKNFLIHIPTDISYLFCERGLVFRCQNWGRNARVICNPATGEYVTLPKVTTTSNYDKSCLGYDPINKQFKVLTRYGKPYTHWILTLETGKRLWRRIQDPVFPHSFTRKFLDEKCINGILYYGAEFVNSTMIVSLDLRSEKFGFIKVDEDMLREGLYWTLFNYKGKLGAHMFAYGGKEELVLWVLEDAEKHKWSKIICVIPPLWRKIVKDYKVIGMTGTGEIVFSPLFLLNPFYLFFYNIERDTFTRVNIQGFEEFEQDDPVFIRTFLDYVENTKFM